MGVEAPGLKRSLGLRTVISTSAGLTFASSTFLVVVQVAYYLAGDAAWIAIAIGGALCALAAAAFSELNGMYSSAAGIRLWIQRAFGIKAALIVSLSYMSVVTLVVGTEAYVLSHVLNEAVPQISPPWWIFLMLSLATVFNFRGLKVAGAAQDLITYSVVTSMIIMGVLALSHAQFHIPGPLHTGGVGPVFNAVGVGIFLFVGFEWVTPLAEEVRSAASIPKGMFAALALLVAVYSLIALAMFAEYPGPDGLPLFGRSFLYGTDAAREVIPHVKFATAVLGSTGRWCMIVTSLFMSLTTFNAGLMSVSRFIYSMAREDVLPRGLSRISERFRTPYAAVFLVYVISLTVSAIVYRSRHYVLLVNAAAATESFIYAAAAVTVIRLRRREPGTARPIRMPGGLALPALTGLVFVAVGAGVFFQPGVDFWGAAVLLAVVGLGWWAYIHFGVMPRKARIQAEQAAKRPSRRPGNPSPALPASGEGETRPHP